MSQLPLAAVYSKEPATGLPLPLETMQRNVRCLGWAWKMFTKTFSKESIPPLHFPEKEIEAQKREETCVESCGTLVSSGTTTSL